MASQAKVLITGIEGFTGIHLSQHLRNEGFAVYGISFFKEEPEDDIYKCDIQQLKQIERVIAEIAPDYIIHLAGISFVAGDNINDIYPVNTQGALNVLDACVNLGILPKNIILASSATVYGNQKSSVLSEEMCPMPNSHYANSKLAMENMARNYFGRLPIMLVRPFNYTGQGQALHFIIPKIVEHFKMKKRSIELGNIHVFREFNDIGYVTELYFRMMIAKHKSEVVNFCSGNVNSLIEVIKMLTAMTGHQIKININPKYVRQNEIPSLSGSTTKLEELLGSLPDNISLQNTLSKMLDC